MLRCWSDVCSALVQGHIKLFITLSVLKGTADQDRRRQTRDCYRFYTVVFQSGSARLAFDKSSDEVV